MKTHLVESLTDTYSVKLYPNQYKYLLKTFGAVQAFHKYGWDLSKTNVVSGTLENLKLLADTCEDDSQFITGADKNSAIMVASLIASLVNTVEHDEYVKSKR